MAIDRRHATIYANTEVYQGGSPHPAPVRVGKAVAERSVTPALSAILKAMTRAGRVSFTMR
jgi:hypothetical protein